MPCPAAHLLESALAVGVKNAFVVLDPLIVDPMTELVAIERVGRRDASVTVAFDICLELVETLLPQVGFGVPCPAGHVLESAFAIGLKGALTMVSALRTGPHAKLIAADRAGHRHAGITLVLDVFDESAEPFLPLVGLGVPCPAGQVLKSAFAIVVNDAFGVLVALNADPLTELVTIDLVGHRNPRVTVVLDVFHEAAETLLPLIDERVPCPAGQVLEAAFRLGVKAAFGVAVALLTDPPAEPVTIDAVRVRDPCMTVAFDVVLEAAEALLPLVG